MRIPFSAASRFLGVLFPRRLMRADWDLRARSDAAYYIDCGHGVSPAAFWRSGEEDLQTQVLKGIRLSQDAVVLEIGCGIGRLLRAMRRRARLAIGVDISGEMIDRARAELLPDEGIRLLRTDGDLRDVPDGSIDFVYSFIVFQHVPSRSAVLTYLRESSRVLRPGGLLRFQADGRARRWLKPPNTWSGVRLRPADLERQLGQNGLEVLELTSAGTQSMWVTAGRTFGAFDRATRAVSFAARRWKAAELDGLLRRLGCGESEAARVMSGRATVRGLASAFLRRGVSLEAEPYVQEAYRAILDRPPDAEGLATYAREIREGIPRDNVIDCLIASPEFDALYRREAEDGGSGRDVIPAEDNGG